METVPLQSPKPAKEEQAQAQAQAKAQPPIQAQAPAEAELFTPVQKEEQEVELLGHESSAIRLPALSRLIDFLQSGVQHDYVNRHLERLQLHVLNRVRRGPQVESILACRILTLLSLTLGPDSEPLLHAAAPTLHAVLKDGNGDSGERVAAMQAYGFMHFLASFHKSEALAAMEALGAMLQEPQGYELQEGVAAVCWQAWGLLASSLPKSKLGGPIFEQYLPLLMGFLDFDSPDVKTAAGENIALLWEGKQELEEEKREQQAAAAGSAAAAATGRIVESKMTVEASSSSSSSAFRVDMPTLLDKIRALSKESSRQISKEQRVALKRTFRDVLRTMESGETPFETVEIGSARHDFAGWRHLKQLAMVRHVCGTGLPVHLSANGTLEALFDLQPTEVLGLPHVDEGTRRAEELAQRRAKAREIYQTRDMKRTEKRALFKLHSGIVTEEDEE